METGDPQSFNRYSYVENDPVNLVDPSGLFYLTDGVSNGIGGFHYGPDGVYGGIHGDLNIIILNLYRDDGSKGNDRQRTGQLVSFIDWGTGSSFRFVRATANTGQSDQNKSQRCAALIKRMVRQITELDRLWKNYDPVKDFFGGYPIRKRGPSGRVIELGKSKPGGHYKGLINNQKALQSNLEAFKRECIDGNNNSNPGLPSGADDWASRDIPAPYDPNAPTLFDSIWDLFPNFPTEREMERNRRQYPELFPLPLPVPVPVP
jgi:hypothetical protein